MPVRAGARAVGRSAAGPAGGRTGGRADCLTGRGPRSTGYGVASWWGGLAKYGPEGYGVASWRGERDRGGEGLTARRGGEIILTIKKLSY